MGAHVGQPEWSWITNQHPENATTARPVADRSLLLLREPASDKALELATPFVEDPECRVPRSRNRARRLQQPVQQHIQIELGNQFRPDRDQLSQPILFDNVAHVALTQHASNTSSRRDHHQFDRYFDSCSGLRRADQPEEYDQCPV